MRRQGDLLFSIGILVFLVLFLLYYLVKCCYRRVQRQNFIKEQMILHDGMPQETAETLHDAARARQHFQNAKKYYRSKSYRGRIDKAEYDAICADEYYQLLRWSKRLHDAKSQDPDTLDTTVSSIINELNERAEQCLVNPKKKEQLLNLVKHQNEDFLREYDNLFV